MSPNESGAPPDPAPTRDAAPGTAGSNPESARELTATAMHAPEAHAPDPHAVPRQTTPAWEQELLLSIGLVIGLLQLPAVLDARFDAAFARASDPWLMQIMYVYLYTKVAIYGLVGTFIVHLLARGYWVALLGMRSVFPEGVRWDRLSPRIGPVARELARAETEDASRSIERVDNFASGTFGFGFILLSTAVTIGLMTVVVVAIATFVSQILFDGRFQLQTVTALIAIVVVPYSLGALFDRYYGDRLAVGSRRRRILERVLSIWRNVYGTRIYRQMMLVYATNLGWKQATWLVSGSLFALLSGTMFEIMLRRNIVEPLATDLVPRMGSAVAQRSTYADQRGADFRYDMTPFIQSDIVTGPYLRLFAPASPRRFPAAMRSDCPEVALDPVEDFNAEAARRRAVLACLGRLLDVRVDGESVPDLAFEFAEDPASTLPGVIAYVPVADLAPGRHELTIVRIRRAGDEARPDRDTVRIPFWR